MASKNPGRTPRQLGSIVGRKPCSPRDLLETHLGMPGRHKGCYGLGEVFTEDEAALPPAPVSPRTGRRDVYELALCLDGVCPTDPFASGLFLLPSSLFPTPLRLWGELPFGDWIRHVQSGGTTRSSI